MEVRSSSGTIWRVPAARQPSWDLTRSRSFPRRPTALEPGQLARLLDEYRLRLAAVGTGAGWVLQRLTLTDADPTRREQALAFVRQIIDVAGPFGASAIIGSMQGRWVEPVDRNRAFELLRSARRLRTSRRGARRAIDLEPLNRYETNLCNTLAAGVELLTGLPTGRVVLLADLFHMNIEEQDLAAAIRAAGPHLRTRPFRRLQPPRRRHGAPGFRPTLAALWSIDYRGYLSAEALPWPDSATAGRSTIDTYRQYFCR